MALFFNFLINYQALIYLIAGIITLLSFRRFWLAWNEHQSAVFSLEKEATQQRMVSSLTVVILSGMLLVAEFVLTTVLVTSVPGLTALSTPTLDLNTTPTVTLSLDIGGVANATAPAQTPGTSNSGCVAGKLEWTDPKAGDEIRSNIELRGTVNIANLGFYKFEYRLLGTDTWTTIAGNSQSVVDGPLGATWNISQLATGDYQLHLVAMDNQNNALPDCMIQVRVFGK